jgi:hypothetical protein
MEGESFLGHILGFVDVSAGRDAAWKVWKRHAEVAPRVFVYDCDVVCHDHTSIESDSRLAFDTFQSANRYVLFRVWNGNTPLFIWMQKLGMGADFCHFAPTILFENLDNCSAIHGVYLYTFWQDVSRKKLSR